MNKLINRLYDVNAEIEKLDSERRDIIQKLNRRIEDINNLKACCSELQNECETQERAKKTNQMLLSTRNALKSSPKLWSCSTTKAKPSPMLR